MKVSVHLAYPPGEEAAVAHLHAVLHPDVHLTLGPELPSAPVYQILVAGRPEREQVTASPHLQALIVPWAGVPHSTWELMREFPDVAVHNLHHNALPVAELAIALLLAAAKFIVPFDQALRNHDWTPRYGPSGTVLLSGKRALILGYGGIGQNVARLCQGLGMVVTAVRRYGNVSSGEIGGKPALETAGALHSLLPQADALVICLPHTPETEGLIGARELALLPPRAVLVNVGRGPVVDQAALYHALRDGTLYAAGLDVWYHYPEDEESRAHTAPSAYPFHELDNVVMSPHRGGKCVETEMLRMAHLAELLNAAAQGEQMPNRVDMQEGY